MKLTIENTMTAQDAKSFRDEVAPVLRKWASIVKERDGKCAKCGATENLEAHHIFSFNMDPYRLYEISNGVTLCKHCHREKGGFHSQYGFKNSTDEDLSEFLGYEIVEVESDGLDSEQEMLDEMASE